MEEIIGIKLGGNDFEYTEHNIYMCSSISRYMLKYIIDNYPLTFNQILYPYADMLSLSGKVGTESTQIFGTHIILRNVCGDIVSSLLEYCVKSAIDMTNGVIQPGTVQFSLSEGCVAAEDIAEFLKCECSVQTVGDFGKMLNGFVPHWRIREAAKAFASFSEMSYRISNGAVCGLSGGRLALRDSFNMCRVDEIKKVCFQKTGCR